MKITDSRTRIVCFALTLFLAAILASELKFDIQTARAEPLASHLTPPSIMIDMPDVAQPGQPFKITVTFYNIGSTDFPYQGVIRAYQRWPEVNTQLVEIENGEYYYGWGGGRDDMAAWMLRGQLEGKKTAHYVFETTAPVVPGTYHMVEAVLVTGNYPGSFSASHDLLVQPLENRFLYAPRIQKLEYVPTENKVFVTGADFSLGIDGRVIIRQGDKMAEISRTQLLHERGWAAGNLFFTPPFQGQLTVEVELSEGEKMVRSASYDVEVRNYWTDDFTVRPVLPGNPDMTIMVGRSRTWVKIATPSDMKVLDILTHNIAHTYSLGERFLYQGDLGYADLLQEMHETAMHAFRNGGSDPRILIADDIILLELLTS